MFSPHWHNALKLFLPSWNFFNDFGIVFRLEAQRRDDGRAEPAWLPIYPSSSSSRLARVFWNPEGNLALLEKSLIETIAEEIQSNPARTAGSFASSESFLMLTRIVRTRLPPGPFRFRLVMSEAGRPAEELFVSEWIPPAG